MRHGKGGFKLNRTKSHRNSLFRNLLTSLFEYEKIKTTSTKAKAIKPLADKLITLAKRGDLASRRQASRILYGSEILKKLFDELVPRFKSRNSGYTRIYKIGHRKGDSAEVSLIELILDKVETKSAEKKDEKDSSSSEDKSVKSKVKKVLKSSKKSEAKKKEEKKKETKKKDTTKKVEKKEKKETKKKTVKETSKKKPAAKKVGTKKVSTTSKAKKSSPSRKKG